MADYDDPVLEEEETPTEYLPRPVPIKPSVTLPVSGNVLPPVKAQVVEESAVASKKGSKNKARWGVVAKQSPTVDPVAKSEPVIDTIGSPFVTTPVPQIISESAAKQSPIVPADSKTPSPVVKNENVPKPAPTLTPISPVVLALSTPIFGPEKEGTAFSPIIPRRPLRGKNYQIYRWDPALLETKGHLIDVGDTLELPPGNYTNLLIKAGVVYRAMGQILFQEISFSEISTHLTQIIGVDLMIPGPLVLKSNLYFEKCSFEFTKLDKATSLIEADADLSFENCSFKVKYQLNLRDLTICTVVKNRSTFTNCTFFVEAISRASVCFFQVSGQLLLQTNRFFILDSGQSQHRFIMGQVNSSVVTVANILIWTNHFSQSKITLGTNMAYDRVILVPESNWYLK